LPNIPPPKKKNGGGLPPVPKMDPMHVNGKCKIICAALNGLQYAVWHIKNKLLYLPCNVTWALGHEFWEVFLSSLLF
jgi:hypothetical protein